RTLWNMHDRVALFAALTAAMFIKGPVVWAFVLPPLVLYQLRRRWRPDFPSAWSGWTPWIASSALFCLWVITVIRFIDGFYEVVDSVKKGRSNFSGCSSPLPFAGCATEGDQYCSHSPAGGSHYHFGCDLYRCLFGDANDRRLSQQSRCAGEVRPRSSTDGCGRTSALRNSSRAR